MVVNSLKVLCLNCFYLFLKGAGQNSKTSLLHSYTLAQRITFEWSVTLSPKVSFAQFIYLLLLFKPSLNFYFV